MNKEIFLQSIDGMKNETPQFGVVTVLKAGYDEFKLFYFGEYVANPATTDDHGNGGHWGGRELYEHLNKNITLGHQEESEAPNEEKIADGNGI